MVRTQAEGLIPRTHHLSCSPHAIETIMRVFSWTSAAHIKDLETGGGSGDLAPKKLFMPCV